MAEFVVFDDETNDPNKTAVVASFSNGRLKLESESSNNVQFGYFCSTGRAIADKGQKILVAETDRMTYIAKNFGTDAVAAPTMCKYMLGIYDKRTSKVRLVDANLFHLRPKLEDPDESGEEGQKNEDDTSEIQMTFAEKQARLILQFGTAKGKRAIKSRQRNKVDAIELETALKNMVSESQEVLNDTEDPADSAPTVIPPYNKDAQRPEDVFNIDDLISPEEMSVMHGPASIFINASSKDIAQWRETNKYPGYILNLLSILPVQSDIRRLRACQLRYWCYLHKLLRAGNKSNMIGLLNDAPYVVRQNLFKRFTIVHSDTNDKPSHLMPRRLKDLLRSYMLVLCLIFEEFSLEFSALQKDLDIPLPKLEKCFQALGCKTARPASKDLVGGRTSKLFKATLSVPLKFPSYKALAGRR